MFKTQVNFQNSTLLYITYLKTSVLEKNEGRGEPDSYALALFKFWNLKASLNPCNIRALNQVGNRGPLFHKHQRSWSTMAPTCSQTSEEPSACIWVSHSWVWSRT